MIAWSRDESGVSLLELLLAMAILGLITLGILGLWRSTQESYLQGSRAADLQQNARVALEQMAREIRQAGLDPTGATFAGCISTYTPPCPVEEATATTIRVKADGIGTATADGTITGSENVRYSYDAGSQQIDRTPGDSTAQPLADNITSLAFTYWRTNAVTGAPEQFTPSSQADRGSIRRVTISVTALESVGGQTLSHTLTTSVSLRNP